MPERMRITPYKAEAPSMPKQLSYSIPTSHDVMSSNTLPSDSAPATEGRSYIAQTLITTHSVLPEIADEHAANAAYQRRLQDTKSRIMLVGGALAFWMGVELAKRM
ncbi:hypothetical protein BJX63DRAFT_392311 [Aspergillus granulosus]|uniref:Uncharacterized protein n=1 Tax=Aspergillus granulosus TaxID=176169 RepID=A0ABR4HG50_9EURO